MMRHPILLLHQPALFHIAQGQLIEQSRSEYVFNLMKKTYTESLRRLFTQVYKNYAVLYYIHFHAFLTFLFYVKL